MPDVRHLYANVGQKSHLDLTHQRTPGLSVQAYRLLLPHARAFRRFPSPPRYRTRHQCPKFDLLQEFGRETYPCLRA
jgi:hypothetical protein